MADGLNVVAQDKLISKLFADSIKQIFNNSISVNPYAIDEIMNDHPLSINKMQRNQTKAPYASRKY